MKHKFRLGEIEENNYGDAGSVYIVYVGCIYCGCEYASSFTYMNRPSNKYFFDEAVRICLEKFKNCDDNDVYKGTIEISDKIGTGDCAEHLGISGSLFIKHGKEMRLSRVKERVKIGRHWVWKYFWSRAEVFEYEKESWLDEIKKIRIERLKERRLRRKEEIIREILE